MKTLINLNIKYRKDNTRALARERKKERESDIKQRKANEIKQLKMLKKQEIMEKLQEIAEITGSTGIVNLKEKS